MSERVDLSEILKEMPKRGIKKYTIDLPQDQISVVDVCAKTLGLSRSAFLLLWFDSSQKAMIDWTNTLLGRSQIEIVENDKGGKKK
jgi:hypothetical protein